VLLPANTVTPIPHVRSVTGDPGSAGALATIAIAVPALLAYNLPPSATFLNQAAAIVGWACLLAWFAFATNGLRVAWRTGLAALLGALALVAVATIASTWWAALPSPLALSTVATIAAAMLATLVGAAAVQSGRGEAAFRAVCIGLLIAGVLSVLIGIIQVFAPDLADGAWVAATASEGRASGNVRQPNHLSSLLLWSFIAAIWLGEAARMGRAWTASLTTFFLFGLVLAASRTGVVGVALLALWGLLDRRLTKGSRLVLLLAPVVYLVFFSGLSLWAHASHQMFGGEARLAESEGGPNSRLNIWSNTLSLIAAHPWLGVGPGEFNFAWSMTPFPGRPTAFFDHTHDLPLQFAVEMGVPLALLVLALLVWASWRSFAVSRNAALPQASLLRAAFMMVLMIALHSMFEYPLWYAYFLLPAAFVFGLTLGADVPAAARAVWPATARVALVVACAVMLGGGIGSVVDYRRVAAIFYADDAKPLDQRIADGERSWFFAHHAHYAAVTTAEHPSDEMASFAVAAHYLLDTRLMMAWAHAYAEAGDIERARHIAARLREFRNEDAKAFFAPCDEPHAAGADLPFQCTPPTKAFDYRDFR
jgi:O-antigen ligase